MKTPREVLFAKHRHATRELDAITARVLEQLQGEQTFSWKTLWDSLRWQRVALSSAWMLVLVMHIAGRMESPGGSTKDLAAEDRLALRERRLLMNEFLQPAAGDFVLAPGPRTHLVPTWFKG